MTYRPKWQITFDRDLESLTEMFEGGTATCRYFGKRIDQQIKARAVEIVEEAKRLYPDNELAATTYIAWLVAELEKEQGRIWKEDYPAEDDEASQQ